MSSETDSGDINGSRYDAVIVGGGAAGLATAITTAAAGLSTLIIEAAAFPRRRPGEALHPGVETVFRQLGISAGVDACSPLRHTGVFVNTQAGVEFSAFGSDASGAWRGYQISRDELDPLLQSRATAAGARVLQPARVTAVHYVQKGWRVATSRGTIAARFLIDASGPGHWLARHLSLPVTRLSPRLVARYGYRADERATAAPVFTEGREGWTWTALVKPGVLQWVGLPLQAGTRVTAPDGMTVKGADVTWRVVERCAGSGCFLVGDAAAVLDPACSHGVLRALMSGIYAGWLAAAIKDGKSDMETAAGVYRSWLLGWVCRDAMELVQRYAQMAHPPGWLQAAASACAGIRSGIESPQRMRPS